MSAAKPTYMRPVLEAAIASGELTREVRKAANWSLVTIDDLTARLAEAELLWKTAIDNEGTDWADDIIEAAKGGRDE